MSAISARYQISSTHWREQRSILDAIGHQLYVYEPSHWYNIVEKDVKRIGGHDLFQQYDSLPQALHNIYIEEDWKPWRFRESRKIWEDEETQRQYVEWLSHQLQITCPEQWSSVKFDNIKLFEGISRLMNRYDQSLLSMLRHLYPHSKWHAWTFGNPNHQTDWNQWEVRRSYMEWLTDKVGTDTRCEGWWKGFSLDQIQRSQGQRVLDYYQSSMYALLEDLYHEHAVYPWSFPDDKYAKGILASPAFWEDLETQCEYLGWLAVQLKISCPEQWYRHQNIDIDSPYKNVLLKYHYGSHMEMLRKLYAEYMWIPWLFDTCLRPASHLDSIHNQRELLDWIASQLHIRNYEEWYRVPAESIILKGGKSILDRYGGSIWRMLVFLYKEHEWCPWLFVPVPAGFWPEISNQRSYMDWLANELGLKKYADWYNVTPPEIKKRKGTALLQRYHNSMLKLVKAVYPEYAWKPWMFVSEPNTLWESVDNQRLFIEWFAECTNVERAEQLYSIQKEKIIELGGSILLERYEGSLIKALVNLYPNYDWKMWLFPFVPMGFWESVVNQDRYIEWFVEKLGVQSPEDWGKLTAADLKHHKGASMYQQYFMTDLPTFLRLQYPEYPWHPWFFAHDYSLWSIRDRRMEYMKWIEEKLNVTHMNQWYDVRIGDLRDHYGEKLISQFDDKLINLLSDVYPEYSWKPWLFTKSPSNYWKDGENIEEYIKWLTPQLDVVSFQDVYSITCEEIGELQGLSLVKQIGLYKFLGKMFPQYAEQLISGKNRTSSKSQTRLLRMLREIFSAHTDLSELCTNFKHPALNYPQSQRSMELDIYVPSLGLAFEYQGPQHFNRQFQSSMPQARQLRDLSKVERCKEVGITLVQVPYWWERQEDNLLATIHQYRCDVVKQSGSGTAFALEE